MVNFSDSEAVVDILEAVDTTFESVSLGNVVSRADTGNGFYCVFSFEYTLVFEVLAWARGGELWAEGWVSVCCKRRFWCVLRVWVDSAVSTGTFAFWTLPTGGLRCQLSVKG